MTEKFETSKEIDVTKLVSLGFIGAISVAAAAGLAVAAKKLHESRKGDEQEDEDL